MSQLSAIGKWLAGILAAVIVGLILWWLKGGPLNPTMEISGIWHTPYKKLDYRINQKQNHFVWLIPETGITGEGEIDGKIVVLHINGKKVTYHGWKFDYKGDPAVLFTTQPEYTTVVLFRTCNDFASYIIDRGKKSPPLKLAIYQYLQKLSEPTCPNVLHQMMGGT